MKTDQELANELRVAVNNIAGMEYFVNKGVVVFIPDKLHVEVNYLLWHSFSDKGLAKFCHSLYFNMRMKLVGTEKADITFEPILIIVNYGTERNKYGRKGLVKMCRYNSVTGFDVV